MTHILILSIMMNTRQTQHFNKHKIIIIIKKNGRESFRYNLNLENNNKFACQQTLIQI